MSDQQQLWRQVGRYSTVGIELAVIWVLAMLAGAWVDRRWGLKPIGVLVGVAVAIGASLRLFVRVVRQYRADFP